MGTIRYRWVMISGRFHQPELQNLCLDLVAQVYRSYWVNVEEIDLVGFVIS